MFVTVEELIGVNSLIDGEKIWGFSEKIPEDIQKYAEVTAKKLLERGKEATDLLVATLKQYKAAKSYLVINGVNAAKTEKGWIVLLKKDMTYCLAALADRTFYSILKEQLLMDKEKETSETKEKITWENFARNYTNGIEDYTLIYRYDNGKVEDFELFYNRQGKKYIYDFMKSEHEEADNYKIGNRIRRYMKK